MNPIEDETATHQLAGLAHITGVKTLSAGSDNIQPRGSAQRDQPNVTRVLRKRLEGAYVDNELKRILGLVVRAQSLKREQARAVFGEIMAGGLSDVECAALVTALHTKGECADEVVGAAEAMRESSVRISGGEDAIDTCGTGGDGVSTFNVSTAAAIIAAASGAKVAKHGNRSTTRVSGSTEVLAHLGIDVDADKTTVERCLREIGIGYLNARNLHPAMRYAAPVRGALPFRTIFNVLGPLTNPAGVRRQLVGVPTLDLVDLVSQALLQLKVEHAWVVHGKDGLCDLTITSSTLVAEIRDRRITHFEVVPERAGLHRGALDDLLIDSPEASAAVVTGVLRGEAGAPRDHTLLNAGAALVIGGLAKELRAGVALAARTIDEGKAMEKLEQWRAIAPARDSGSDNLESNA